MAGERDEGQAAVELALVLPLVVLLLLTVVQVTLVARDQILVVHAARAAARAAAVEAATGRQREARAAVSEEGLKSGRTHVEVLTVGADPTLIVASVHYVAPTDVPLVGRLLPDVPLQAKAAMRAEMPSHLRLSVVDRRNAAGVGIAGSEPPTSAPVPRDARRQQ